jgi:hypothetical protein
MRPYGQRKPRPNAQIVKSQITRRTKRGLGRRYAARKSAPKQFLDDLANEALMDKRRFDDSDYSVA